MGAALSCAAEVSRAENGVQSAYCSWNQSAVAIPDVGTGLRSCDACPMFFDSWQNIVHVLVTGILGYVAIVLLLRVSGKRTLSKMNAFDFVVTISLGSTLATLMLSRDVPLVEGVTAFVVLIGGQFIVTRLSLQFECFQGLVKAQPSLLYHRGEYLERALRRERVTHEEIQAAVRAQGIGSWDDVEAVVLETEGQVSVLTSATSSAKSTLRGVKGIAKVPDE